MRRLESIEVMGLILLRLALTSGAQAEVPPHLWSQSYGSAGLDIGRAVVVDPSGNTIVTGHFDGTLDLGGGYLLSAGNNDVFVVKLDASGGLIWGRSWGSSDNEQGMDVAVDSAGNIYLTGFFRSTLDFGGGPLVSAGQDDIFLVKLDPIGVHVWSQSFGDSNRDYGYEIAVSHTGHVYLTGSFEGTVDLGGGPLVSAGDSDILLGKFMTTTGSHVWSQSFGGIDEDGGIGLAVDGDGDVILTGFHEGGVNFGGGPLFGVGDHDICLAKFDASGAHQWSQSFGSSGTDRGMDVVADGSGNVVLTGVFSSAVDFGGGMITSAGGLDLFVAKYDPAGGHAWSRGFGHTDEDNGHGISVNEAGEIFLTGDFRGVIDFGGGQLVSTGEGDIFLTKLKGNGNLLWSQHFGDERDDAGVAVAVSSTGSVVLTGIFQGRVDFGGGLLSSEGESLDIVVAEYDTDGNHLRSQSYGGSGIDFGDDVAVDSAGNVLVTGTYNGTVNFGGGPLVGEGASDIFLVKFDANGNHLWSRSFGDFATDMGISVTVDAADDVLVTGMFMYSVDFGGGPLVSAGYRDIFLAKYDAAGTHLWSRSFGGSGWDQGTCVAVDAAGNVILTGRFEDAIDLGGGPLVSVGSFDAFLAMYDAAGGHLWSRSFGDVDSDRGESVVVNTGMAGEVVVTGGFRGTVDFGGGPLTSAGEYDVFIAGFDAGGGHVWSRSFGGPESDLGYSVAVDGSGDVTITGTFQGTADFGGAPLTSAGGSDVFLAKYDAIGTHRWSQGFGGDSMDLGYVVSVDGRDEVLLTGNFYSSAIDFGGGALANAGDWDIFAAKFRSVGEHLWSERFGGVSGDVARSSRVDGAGNVYLTGQFLETMDLGGGPLVSRGSTDIFVAKFESSTSGIEPTIMEGSGLALCPARPNPFGGETTMALDLPARAKTLVTVYGVAGRLVRTLLERELDPGRHLIAWDGRDESGRRMAPGIYLMRVEADECSITRKVVRVE